MIRKKKRKGNRSKRKKEQQKKQIGIAKVQVKIGKISRGEYVTFQNSISKGAEVICVLCSVTFHRVCIGIGHDNIFVIQKVSSVHYLYR